MSAPARASTARRAVVAPHDLDETLGRIAGGARRILAADRATCYVVAPLTRVVAAVHTTEGDMAVRTRLEASIGHGADRLPLWADLLASDDGLVVADASQPGRIGLLLRALDTGTLLLMRLEAPSRAAAGPTMSGALAVSYRDRRAIDAAEVETLRWVADLAAIALAQSRVQCATLDRLSLAEAGTDQDALTGLPTFRAFQERLAAERSHASRHERELHVVLVDVDHMADINRHEGHATGDGVLREVGRRLRTAFRPGDLVARVESDCFAAIVPGVSQAEVWDLADQARRAVAVAPFPGAGRVTVSAGVGACGPRDGEDPVRLAGGALYWAKENGRDTTLVYAPGLVPALSAQEHADALLHEQALTSVRLLARVVDAKDPSTQRHSERVAVIADRLALARGWPDDERELLREAALVHDVGKIAVPDAILFKPGRLTAQEYEQVKQHAAVGAGMLREVLMPRQVEWVLCHHERFDGRGYPRGVGGAAIPEGARILALADAVDVMLTARPYSRPRSPEDALAECRREAGAQFDPALVALLDGIDLGAIREGARRPPGVSSDRPVST